MIVDDIVDDRDALRVRGVDQSLKSGRPAIIVLNREDISGVMARDILPGKSSDGMI